MTSRSVKVRIPSDTGYVPLLRTTIAGIAARESFTLEEVDDLRMAVEEAAVLLLRRGDNDSLSLDVVVTDSRLEATLSTAASADAEPIDETSFPWMILSALAEEVKTDRSDGELRIVLMKDRSTADAHE